MSHPRTEQFAQRPFCWLPALVVLLGVFSLGVSAATPSIDESLRPPLAAKDRPAIEARADELLQRVLPTLSHDQLLRRWVAQATFCLPQNLVGIGYYALLRLAGRVEVVATHHEIALVVTRSPFGASLGRFLFLGEAYLTETNVRHEYGHTLQGYMRGPFYLLFEGVTSFVQAALSMVFPSFATSYYDRWPENEADRLGGVRSRP